MKSNICYMENAAERENVLIEVEKTAVYCGLVHKDALRLRLLAEELMGMTAKIIGNYNAAFWVETHQPIFELNLGLDMKLSPQDRKQILSVVPKDDPKKLMGIMDRIRLFFEHCVSSYEESRTWGHSCSLYLTLSASCVLITWISLSVPRSTGVKMSVRPCVM